MSNCRSGWCRVRFGGKSGWSAKNYLREEVAATPAPEEKKDTRQAAPQPAPFPPAVPKTETSSTQKAAPPSASSELGRTACVSGVSDGATLKVHAGPGTQHELLYGYYHDTCGVKITGACKSGWCPVDYQGYRGWARATNLR